MKISLTGLMVLAAGPAMAHGVHANTVGGHDHIAAFVALGVAGIAVIVGIIRSKAA